MQTTISLIFLIGLAAAAPEVTPVVNMPRGLAEIHSRMASLTTFGHKKRDNCMSACLEYYTGYCMDEACAAGEDMNWYVPSRHFQPSFLVLANVLISPLAGFVAIPTVLARSVQALTAECLTGIVVFIFLLSCGQYLAGIYEA